MKVFVTLYFRNMQKFANEMWSLETGHNFSAVVYNLETWCGLNKIVKK